MPSRCLADAFPVPVRRCIMASVHVHLVVTVAVVGALLTGCTSVRSGGSRTSPFTVARSVADSITTEQLAPGVRLHHLVRVGPPLRAHVLDIDLSACVAMRALKGATTAVGRTTTSDLLRSLAPADTPIAAVNADFFLFAPPGVPVGALVVDGRLIAGPIARPVLAFDSQQRPYIGTLTVAATLSGVRGRTEIATWNRPSAIVAGIVDAAWGQPLDSLVKPTARALVPVTGMSAARRFVVRTLPVSHSTIALGDTLLLVGPHTTTAEIGDTVVVETTLRPTMPRTAVGGFPLLLRDSMIVATVDSDGAASFRGVNPRTAAGYSMNGRRLLLVVIDGRQPGFSVGTTSRETAELLRDLGAREAVNLDGGGSTAMVVRDVTSGAIRVVNKPSDAAGERPVANALAVTGACGRR